MSDQETVFITGGGSGIGKGLASAFHARGAKVIISGRTRASLEIVAAKHAGMEIEDIDVADAVAVSACADRVASRHRAITTVICNAGIQHLNDFANNAPIEPARIAEEIDINFKGLILVSNAFLPILRQQRAARLVHIGSGLGYVPLTAAPIYSATKAAVHSFSISLRRQLRGSSVRVIEIIPPVVETSLHRSQDRKPPNALTLDTFVKSAMTGLDSGRDEIAIGLARVLRVAHRAAPGLFLRIVNKQRN